MFFWRFTLKTIPRPIVTADDDNNYSDSERKMTIDGRTEAFSYCCPIADGAHISVPPYFGSAKMGAIGLCPISAGRNRRGRTEVKIEERLVGAF